MVFLIRYNRKSGRIVTKQAFEHADREKAQKARLELELEVNRNGIEDEVVLLEAESESVLRRTHRRYFENLRELASNPAH